MTETKNETRWQSVDEIADHLGINRETVYRWISKKGLPAHKIGRIFRFQISEVDEWVREGQSGDFKEGGES